MERCPRCFLVGATWAHIEGCKGTPPPCPSCASLRAELTRLRADKEYLIRMKDDLATTVCEQEDELKYLRSENAQLKQDAISGRQEVDKLCDLYRRDYVMGLVEENSRLRGIEERAGEGIRRILAERVRQKDTEGWTPEHDAQHDEGELSIAAACYAVNDLLSPVAVHMKEFGPGMRNLICLDAWPWDSDWDKRDKHDRLRSLEIAGALIAAEIDRITESALLRERGKGGNG